ncbi:Basic-leucine zipper [Gracilaria domingensis]|nr:Basic-leucine zipper [Gracilaria domingensis]
MASEFPLYPTHSEAKTLASLVTTSSNEPLSGIQYFHELLRALRDPAFSRFLFANDPIELQHLSHPQLPQFAVANEMLEVNVEPNTNPQDSLSDQWHSRHFTFPAYSSEGKTYGFVVSKDVYLPGSAWGIEHGMVESMTVSRFVKHDEENYTVFFAHYEQFNACRLEYSRMLTNTRQVRFIIAVDVHKFQNVRRQGYLFVKDIIPALLVMQVTEEHRKCPACLQFAGGCYCAAPVVRPRHPFDYEAFRKCTMDSGGVFEGRTSMSLFGGGVKFRSGILGSRFVSRPKFDSELVDGLRRLAITKHIGGESPRHSNIFADAARRLRSKQLRNRVNLCTETALHNSFLTDAGTVSHTVDRTIEPFGLNYLLPSLRDENGSFEGAETNLAPSLVNAVLGPSADLEAFGRTMNLSEEDVLGVQSVDDITHIDSLISDNPTSRHTGELLDDKGQPAEKNTLSLARSNEEKPSADIQIKRLKAELRKERNRACAQRSNMRKKAMMDALKTDIRTIQEKAELLRSQEMLLRRQNIFLRKQVADKFETERRD